MCAAGRERAVPKDLYGAVAEATRTGTVAFEADELDDGLRSGWSVSVSQVTDDVP